MSRTPLSAIPPAKLTDVQLASELDRAAKWMRSPRSGIYGALAGEDWRQVLIEAARRLNARTDKR